MADITETEIHQLATLARLRFSPPEVSALQTQLKQILTAMKTLDSVDTDGIEPMTHAIALELRLRSDVVQSSLAPSVALAAAPAQVNDHFVVPAAIGPHQ